MDTSKIDTDYDSILDILKNIKIFLNEHPDCEVKCADYPGGGFIIPRLGWRALSASGEKLKEWTITIDHVREAPDTIKEALRSYDGKTRMIESLRAI
jgi:hypothetical protein